MKLNEDIKRKLIGGILFLVIVALISIIINIFTKGQGTICIISNTTGLPCPSCGLTRSVMYAMTFRFKEAFHYQPLVFFLPIFILLLGYGVVKENKKILRNTIYLIGIVAIVVWVIRMIIYFPDVEPMTYRWGSIVGRLINYILNILGY